MSRAHGEVAVGVPKQLLHRRDVDEVLRAEGGEDVPGHVPRQLERLTVLPGNPSLEGRALPNPVRHEFSTFPISPL